MRKQQLPDSLPAAFRQQQITADDAGPLGDPRGRSVSGPWQNRVVCIVLRAETGHHIGLICRGGPQFVIHGQDLKRLRDGIDAPGFKDTGQQSHTVATAGNRHGDALAPVNRRQTRHKVREYGKESVGELFPQMHLADLRSSRTRSFTGVEAAGYLRTSSAKVAQAASFSPSSRNDIPSFKRLSGAFALPGNLE